MYIGGRDMRIRILGEQSSFETQKVLSWVSGVVGYTDSPIISGTIKGGRCYQDQFISRGLSKGKDKTRGRTEDTAPAFSLITLL